ncbi:aminotransferase class III-fold pyridoxal phosphate-dependent enzyme [Vibrio sp. OCN044]|uniref:Aminotransferase class III-fold pyridoxal phosphate-dependent enzyme n=1 Tax=Vibrio tetraodonis subsp. pristinus TaxID=2695891 RepID=A0A6L8LXQ5_9VIBR|nr:aminotransferase class III-fold pyridoxal phosphate-dependent enzyme [Vibrio tetraodonis subsp. pristinus]
MESAVKLARKITQRRSVVAFTNSYYGMTSTALGLTGNQDNRQMVVDNNVYRLPYDGCFPESNSLELFQKLLDDRSSGYDLPAAVIVETVQGEDRINVASTHWLQQPRALTADKGILLIIEDKLTTSSKNSSKSRSSDSPKDRHERKR